MANKRAKKKAKSVSASENGEILPTENTAEVCESDESAPIENTAELCESAPIENTAELCEAASGEQSAELCEASSEQGEASPPTEKRSFRDGCRERLMRLGSAVSSWGKRLFAWLCGIGKAYRKGTAACRDRWCPRLPLWAVDAAAAVLGVAVTAGVIFAVSLLLPRDAFAFVREGELYFATANGREISLGAIGDKEPYLHFSEDGKRAARVMQDASLLLFSSRGKTEIVAEGVSRLAAVDENGAVHYLKIANESVSVLSFFSDPNKAADDAMTEPVKPALPESIPAPQPVFRSQFATEAEYQDALIAWNRECDRVRAENHSANEAYNAAVRLYNAEAEAWNERVKREGLRQTLGEIRRLAQRVTYCRWQGEEQMPFGEALVLNRAFRWDVAATGAVLFSFCSPASSLTLQADVDAEEHLLRLDTLDIRQSTLYCLTGDEVITPSLIADEFTLSPSGDCLYGYTDADGDGVGELSRLDLSESEATLLGSVKEGSLSFSRDGKCLWIAVDQGVSHLVCEGEVFAGISEAQFTLRSRILALREGDGESTLVLIDGKRERRLHTASWLPSLL